MPDSKNLTNGNSQGDPRTLIAQMYPDLSDLVRYAELNAITQEHVAAVIREVAQLSARQQELFALFWEDMSAPEIAKRLKIKADADVAEASDPFYKTTKYGCCGSYNVFTWYNLLTGQKVFTGTNNVVKISVPNTGGDSLDRYVTFHSNQGASETPELKRLKDLLGVLQYGSSKRVTHRILVRTSAAETLDLGVPEVGVSYQKETKFSDDHQEQEVAL